jgi:methionyl-tRNA formyltransferase
MKFIFASSAPIGSEFLSLLLESNLKYDLVGVLTSPDKPTGRGMGMKSNSVAMVARNLGLEIFQPSNQIEMVDLLKKLEIDLVLTLAYGVLIKPAALSIPKYGWFNLHYSNLPKYRGAAPVQRAIENLDLETGFTIFKLDEGMDTGPILIQKSLPLSKKETTPELLSRLTKLALPELENLLSDLTKLNLREQQGEPSFAPKIRKSEGLINWSQPAVMIAAKYRAFLPWPGIYSILKGKQIIFTKVSYEAVDQPNLQPGEGIIKDGNLLIQCGAGTLICAEIQLENKPKRNVMDFANGIRYQIGQVINFG